MGTSLSHKTHLSHSISQGGEGEGEGEGGIKGQKNAVTLYISKTVDHFWYTGCFASSSINANSNAELCPYFFTSVWFFYAWVGLMGFYMTCKDFYLQHISILPITSLLFILKVMSNIFLLFCYLSQKRTLPNYSWGTEILGF